MTLLAIISLIVTAAALFGWFSSRVLRLPITIGTMLLTVISSLVLMLMEERLPHLHHAAVDMVQRLQFGDLILHGLLGLLLFAGAFLLDLEHLFREKLSVGILSLFGTVFSFASVAWLMHWSLAILGAPVGWLPCLFFGALISPTDPIAVLEMLHRTGVPKNIQAQLAGESLFNDGVGAVIFLAVLDASRGATPTTADVLLSLLIKSVGGLLLGAALAWCISELMRRAEAYQIEILLTLALALGGYAMAEALHVSAPLEAVAAGIALRHFNRRHHHTVISHESLDRFWTVIDEVQNAILFVLLGLEVLVIPFTRFTVLSGALAVVGSLAIRAVIVALLLFIVRLLHRGHKSSFLTMTWGGLRGGLSIALALVVPENYGRSWILATTYIVVIFSILVQGTTLDLFLKKFSSRIAA
jgi:CPA1 family monovalent cation:H+ antiporter